MVEEPKAGDSTSAPAEKKSSKKLLIIGLVLGLVLGGGGAAAVFLIKGDVPAEGKDGEDAANETANQHPEAVETPVVETTFVKLDRLSAPFVYQGRILGYVLLDLSLEVEKGQQEVVIAQQLPALRAAFLIEVTERPIGKPEQPTVIDYEGASRRLLEVANRELKGAELKRILITQSTRL